MSDCRDAEELQIYFQFGNPELGFKPVEVIDQGILAEVESEFCEVEVTHYEERVMYFNLEGNNYVLEREDGEWLLFTG